MVGMEALIRFNSPRLGDVSPTRFIPIAEETGLIVPIGEWVLREVCRQAVEWKSSNHPLVPIAVNISTIQFDREDFADTVARILAESGLDPSLLVLELTESIVMQDIEETTRQMTRIKQLGVRIAIDDFGTGYSSLSYLHCLPIDMLKIDRSFIENINMPEGTRPIVEAVLSMAHALGYTVIAEGVETLDQLATLQKNHCDIIQGYLFSRPLKPAAVAPILLKAKLECKPVAANSVPAPRLSNSSQPVPAVSPVVGAVL
jgi:EAL domain-containing protein (putative c-di-GMP-specific phosphodiesterase class I)